MIRRSAATLAARAVELDREAQTDSKPRTRPEPRSRICYTPRAETLAALAELATLYTVEQLAAVQGRR